MDWPIYSLRPSGDVWFTYSGTAHLATWTMKTWRGSTGRISRLSRPSMVLMWAAHSTMRWGCRWSKTLVLWTSRVTYLKWNVNSICVIKRITQCSWLVAVQKRDFKNKYWYFVTKSLQSLLLQNHYNSLLCSYYCYFYNIN